MRGPLRIRPDVSVTSAADSADIVVSYDFGTQQAVVVPVSERAADLALRFGAGETVDLDGLEADELDLATVFWTHSWLVETDPDGSQRHARQEDYFSARLPAVRGSETQSGLASARVSIIGCGGVGSNLALLLAMAGVANLQLIDGDVVELSNLNRQIPFGLTDGALGRHKATVLAESLGKSFDIATEAEVSTLDDDVISAIEHFKPDTVVVAADEPSIADVVLFVVERFADRPVFVAGGYLGQRSYVGPLLNVGTPACRDCLLLTFGCDHGPMPSRRGIGGTIGPIAAHAAAQASGVLVHHLTGLLAAAHPVINGVCEYDHDSGQTRNVPIGLCARCASG